jgi:2-polyprenyl-3-methyl-5-hydroxy-6-metoxy-1,4-benzoquinol methylase
MRWPFRRNAVAALELDHGEAERAPPERVVRRSPSFHSLFSHLGEGTSHRILDLGAALGTNVEYFSRFSCRLQIIDLIDSLHADQTAACRAAEHPEAVFEEILPTAGKRFDIVLAWDVFDYLERDQLRALTAHLARICLPGAQMLAFISAAPEISDRPLAFKILDTEHLAQEPRTPVTRPGPRYSPAEVERLVDGFAVDRVILLRHGIREYLLTRRNGV